MFIKENIFTNLNYVRAVNIKYINPILVIIVVTIIPCVILSYFWIIYNWRIIVQINDTNNLINFTNY